MFLMYYRIFFFKIQHITEGVGTLGTYATSGGTVLLIFITLINFFFYLII